MCCCINMQRYASCVYKEIYKQPMHMRKVVFINACMSIQMYACAHALIDTRQITYMHLCMHISI